MQETTESVVHLQVAREASEMKWWNASKITGRKEETIYRECNALLYKALLLNAEQIGPDQPEEAVKACMEALARAIDGKYTCTCFVNLKKIIATSV